MIKSTLGKVMWVGRATVFLMGLALMLALVVGMASTAFGANADNFILGSLNNTASAITKLTGTVGGGPALQVSNPSTATGSTALDLQVATGKAPMKVNRTTKVTNLNSDQVDGKSANALSRVGEMTTGSSGTIPADGSVVTFGEQLSITAPAAGFVRVNGNVTVLNVNSSCTSNCGFTARIRHTQNTSLLSVPQQEDVLDTYGNAGLDAVFPVNAGVNTFEIRLNRDTGGNGTLQSEFGVLTGEYTPYGSTGTGTL